jgi:hypothetical protein
LGLPTQDFILGYSRALPAGGAMCADRQVSGDRASKPARSFNPTQTADHIQSGASSGTPPTPPDNPAFDDAPAAWRCRPQLRSPGSVQWKTPHTLLPCKFRDSASLAHPARQPLLDLPHRLGHGFRRRQTEQNVDVVLRPPTASAFISCSRAIPPMYAHNRSRTLSTIHLRRSFVENTL